jgi:multidrug efflux pump subunit AcrA (membrane-fusion protein)
MIALDEKDARVIPGLTASGDVQVATSESATIVPQAAVVYEDDQPYAFVWTPSGWERRRLELELSDNLNVAVRSGIQPGESVALSRPSEWHNGRSAPTTSVRPKASTPPGV